MAPQAPQSPRVGASEPGLQRATARHGDRPARAPGAAAGGAGRDRTGREGSGKGAEKGREGSRRVAEGQRPRAEVAAAWLAHGPSHAAAPDAQQRLRGLRWAGKAEAGREEAGRAEGGRQARRASSSPAAPRPFHPTLTFTAAVAAMLAAGGPFRPGAAGTAWGSAVSAAIAVH